MNLADIPPEVIERAIGADRPGPISAERARFRMIYRLCRILKTIDAGMEEAGAAGIAAPGLAELRGWCAEAISAQADAAMAAQVPA